jgi:transcription antitermination factor NusG
LSWYAVHVNSRCERRVASELAGGGIEAYLPTVAQTRQWSDRKKLVELPLFSGYVFVHITPVLEEKRRVRDVHGVVGFVGPDTGTIIPDSEIDAVRTMLTNESCEPHPFFKVGQRVRILGGSLEGLEGILVDTNRNKRLVISVNTIGRSLSISLDGLRVEVIQ